MDGFTRDSADRIERQFGSLWVAVGAHGLAAGGRWCPGVPCPGGLSMARATTSAFAGVSGIFYSWPLVDDLPGEVQDGGVVVQDEAGVGGEHDPVQLEGGLST